MAGHVGRQAALVFHAAGRLTGADDRGSLGRVARQGERRNAQVLSDDYFRAQRLRRRSARPDASPLISERLRALATGRSEPRIIEARAERPIAEQKWPVAKRVNSSRASDDDPTLIERVELASV